MSLRYLPKVTAVIDHRAMLGFEHTVDLGGPELSGRNPVLEQDVDFSKCPILCLWKAEPAPDVTKNVCAGVEKSRFGSPVPTCESGRLQLA